MDQSPPSPSPINLLSVLEGVTNWYGIGAWRTLGVPYFKLANIDHRSPTPTASEGLEAARRSGWRTTLPPAGEGWPGLCIGRETWLHEHTALQRVYVPQVPPRYVCCAVCACVPHALSRPVASTSRVVRPNPHPLDHILYLLPPLPNLN